MRQVEQDLIICRALCDLFNASDLKGRIAFRGGTAIHKLLFEQPLRYSEDIDLVQTPESESDLSEPYPKGVRERDGGRDCIATTHTPKRNTPVRYGRSGWIWQSLVYYSNIQT